MVPIFLLFLLFSIEFKNSNFQDYYFRTFGRAPQYLGTLLGWILNNGGINHQRQINVVYNKQHRLITKPH